MLACHNEPMATQAARIAPSDSQLPLYRMDAELCERLVQAGAFEGLDVELRDGLLVDRGRTGGEPVHRLDIATYDRMVETGASRTSRWSCSTGCWSR